MRYYSNLEEEIRQNDQYEFNRAYFDEVKINLQIEKLKAQFKEYAINPPEYVIILDKQTIKIDDSAINKATSEDVAIWIQYPYILSSPDVYWKVIDKLKPNYI